MFPVQLDLETIKDMYLEKFDVTLKDALSSDCSGDFKRLLLAILHWGERTWGMCSSTVLTCPRLLPPVSNTWQVLLSYLQLYRTVDFNNLTMTVFNLLVKSLVAWSLWVKLRFRVNILLYYKFVYLFLIFLVVIIHQF